MNSPSATIYIAILLALVLLSAKAALETFARRRRLRRTRERTARGFSPIVNEPKIH